MDTHAEEDTIPEQEARESLIRRITQMDCDSRKPARAQAEHLADDVRPFHPDNPNCTYTDAEVDEHIKATLNYEQNERTLEQNFLLGALGRLIVYCAPFVGAAFYALTLPQREQKILGLALPAAFVTLITYSFHHVVQSARRALDHRHMQVRILTKEFPKYRAWGFDWRERDGHDRDHRLTIWHSSVSMVLLVVICGLLALWVVYLS
jgi:hypothetical protein